MKRVLAVLIMVMVGSFVWSYPGLVEELWQESRDATWAEMRDDADFFFYNLKYFQMLRQNPETGMYDLGEALRKPASDPFDNAKLQYHAGLFSKTISLIEADIAQRGANVSKLLWLGVAYQRQAEQEGCLAHLQTMEQGWRPDTLHQGGVCALPIQPVPEAAPSMRKAAAVFERLLDDYDSADQLALWLLNFSYMALGGYPDEVPERYLVDNDFTDAFYGEKAAATRERFPNLVFEDRAHELGVAVNDAGKGVAVEDFDGDGWLDIVTGGSFSGLHYFRNVRGEHFVDETERVGLGDATQPFIITAADYDNDGWIDLFIGRPYHVFALFRNRGNDQGFEDVTKNAGLLDAVQPGQSVFTVVSAWSDIDNDGDLDLFLAQLGRRLPYRSGLMGRPPMRSTLFLNDAGNFRDATDDYGLKQVVADRTFTGAAFGDYDNDGYTDLYLSSFTPGVSVLLRNLGGERFVPTDLIDSGGFGFMTSFLDIDHDGDLDLFQGSSGPIRGVVDRAVFGAPPGRYANKVFMQQDGRFVEQKGFFGATQAGTMGASFGDLNHDGCYDFYLGTGNSEPWSVVPTMVYVGERHGMGCVAGATNVSMLSGFGSIQKGHGVVFLDFDNDGDQDIYAALGGMWPADPWPNRLLVNESPPPHSWLSFRLHGRLSNRYGIGARITVRYRSADGTTFQRIQQVGARTGFGSSPYISYFASPVLSEIVEVTVSWPATGVTKSYQVSQRTVNILDENDSNVIMGGGRDSSL